MDERWYSARLDYVQHETQTANIRWLHDLVRAADPKTPTHVNPDGFAKNQPSISRDLADIGRTVDIMGASLHAGHHFSLLDAKVHFCEAFSYYTQRIVSTCRDGHTVLTELQAGPNTWRGNKSSYPDSDDLVQWNLVAQGQGIRGVIYWLWRPRFHG